MTIGIARRDNGGGVESVAFTFTKGDYIDYIRARFIRSYGTPESKGIHIEYSHRKILAA